MLSTGKKMLTKKLNTFLAISLTISSYVLPYPGLMPGHKLYSFKKVFDKVYSFFVFGNFANHKYNLSLADKKLVEAKILFEYNQYPLALTALNDSNFHFDRAVDFLTAAEEEGKDIFQKVINFQEAGQRHKEILKTLKNNLPERFFWEPEKKEVGWLEIGEILDAAIKERDFK